MVHCHPVAAKKPLSRVLCGSEQCSIQHIIAQVGLNGLELIRPLSPSPFLFVCSKRASCSARVRATRPELANYLQRSRAWSEPLMMTRKAVEHEGVLRLALGKATQNKRAPTVLWGSAKTARTYEALRPEHLINRPQLFLSHPGLIYETRVIIPVAPEVSAAACCIPTSQPPLSAYRKRGFSLVLCL